jgi:hypothetical protein
MATSAASLEHDPAFHQWSWRVEWTAWVLMLLILVAALLGLFGPGLFGHKHLRADDGSLALEYDRFGQVSADTVVNISLQPRKLQHPYNLWINRSYLDTFEIKQIIPSPRAMELSSDGWLYTFGPGQAGEPFPIRLFLIPRHAGVVEGCVNSGGRTLCFRQFVYP